MEYDAHDETRTANDMTDKPADAGSEELAVLMRLMESRHSCRAYLRGQVPDETIRQVLEAAQRTASWCNAQPWRVVVTRGAATDEFRRVYSQAAVAQEPCPDFKFPAAYRGAHLERRRECGWQLYASVGVERGDRAGAQRQALQNFEFFGAPHVAIVTCEAELGVYAAIDCGAYVANFMTAATALGLGCIAQAALAAHPAVVRRHFALPESQFVICGIAFGYADAAHPVNSFRTGRAGLDEVVTWAGPGTSPGT
jgi:nitroreductase